MDLVPGLALALLDGRRRVDHRASSSSRDCSLEGSASAAARGPPFAAGDVRRASPLRSARRVLMQTSTSSAGQSPMERVRRRATQILYALAFTPPVRPRACGRGSRRRRPPCRRERGAIRAAELAKATGVAPGQSRRGGCRPGGGHIREWPLLEHDERGDGRAPAEARIRARAPGPSGEGTLIGVPSVLTTGAMGREDNDVQEFDTRYTRPCGDTRTGQLERPSPGGRARVQAAADPRRRQAGLC